MGKLTISMAIFNSKLLNYQRVSDSNILLIDFVHYMIYVDFPVDFNAQ